MRIINNEELKKIIHRMKHEDLKALSNVLYNLFNDNIGLLLTSKDFGDIRYIQGYLSALTELLSIIPIKEVYYGKEEKSKEEKETT